MTEINQLDETAITIAVYTVWAVYRVFLVRANTLFQQSTQFV